MTSGRLLTLRRRGWATDDQENEAGVNCLAVPAFLFSPSVPTGAVSVSAPAYRTPLSRLVELQWLAGKKDDAKKSLDQLREISGSLDKTAPLYARIAPIAKELGYAEDWKLVKPVAPHAGSLT